MSILLTYPRFKAWDDNGNLLAGGELYTYVPGTDTPQTTYSDIDLTVPNANPIILDATGEAVIYLASATKLVLTVAEGNPSSPLWTMDNVGTQQTEGTQYYIGDYGTLAAAVSAIGSTVATLNVTAGTWPVSGNVTVPSTLALSVQNGAILSVATGVTLTINGSFQAGLYQVFSCTGTGQVVFGEGSVGSLYPQWWGAKGDGATDDTAALTQAFNCMNNSVPTGNNSDVGGNLGGGIPIRLTTSFYTTGNFTMNTGTALYGCNRGTCGFILGNGSGDFLSIGSASGYDPTDTRVTIRDLFIRQKLSTSGYANALHLTNATQCLIDNNQFDGVGSLAAITLTSNANGNCIAIRISNNDMQNGFHGIYFDNTTNGSSQVWITHNRIQDNGGVAIYSPTLVPIQIVVLDNDLEGNTGGAVDIVYSLGCTVSNNHFEGGTSDSALAASAPFRFGSGAYSTVTGLTTNLVFTGNGISAGSGYSYAVDFGYANYAQCQGSTITGNGLGASVAGMAFGLLYNGSTVQSNMYPPTLPTFVYQYLDSSEGVPIVLTPSATVAITINGINANSQVGTAGTLPAMAMNYTLTPGQGETITVTGGMPGQELFLLITTSGTNSYTLTFSTGFHSAGTLATGASSGAVFMLHFKNIGGTFYEVSRTAAM